MAKRKSGSIKKEHTGRPATKKRARSVANKSISDAAAPPINRDHVFAEVEGYALFVMDTEGNVLTWNKGAQKIKGYDAGEIIGKNFRVFYAVADSAAGLPERLLAEAREHGHATQERWRLRKDGERFWGSVTITAIHDNAGNVTGFTKVTRDMTEKKVAEERLNDVVLELRATIERLRESEERYQRMVAEVQDYAIILLNKKGEIENWNAGAEYIKGYKASEIIGKNFRMFYPSEDRASGLPEQLLEEATINGRAVHEGWRLRKGGSRFWGSVVITALHDSSGAVIGYSKVTRDLTERKHLEDSLRDSANQVKQKNKVLERLNQELSSFTYFASHDMKEPLRKIRTFASRIEDLQYNPERSKEFIEKIKNTGMRMQSLIDDLLAYSQLSNTEGKEESVDLNEVLKSVVNDLELLVTEKSAVIEADPLPVMQGVTYQLHQVFLNLISNSMKFAKADLAPRIRIEYEQVEESGFKFRNGRYHHITFADNGIGFEPENNRQIFEAFQRLHSKHTYSGSGIGLAIVKRVVENHQGYVYADGSPARGATFHLFFQVR